MEVNSGTGRTFPKIVFYLYQLFLSKYAVLAVRFLHIALAFLTFFSSSGLLINQHYCRNELKHSALFAPAKGCHAEKKANCPMHAAAHGFQKKGCCNDESLFLKHNQEQIQNEVERVKAPLPATLFALAPVFSSGLFSVDRQTIHYLNYKPPLITRDLPVSLQVFRL